MTANFDVFQVKDLETVIGAPDGVDVAPMDDYQFADRLRYVACCVLWLRLVPPGTVTIV